MKFKEDFEMPMTDGFWYMLVDGGYIKPEDALVNEEDIKRVRDAINVLKEYKREGYKQGAFEEY